MVDAWAWREQRARQRDAWLLANLLQPWSKKRLRPDDFLTRQMSEYEKRAVLTDKLKKMGIH